MAEHAHPGDLAAEADALYAVVPGSFVAARDARARELRAADRELAAGVRGLRRPVVAAWVVNALVRAHGDVVADLLDLGVRMREAQEGLAGDELRRLGREQRAALAAVRSRAADLADDAGQPLTEATWRLVEGTLRAAMADAEAAEAVRSGRLVEPLEPAGFGPVGVGDAVAVPGVPPARPTATAPRAGARPAPSRADERRSAPSRSDARSPAARRRTDEQESRAARRADEQESRAARRRADTALAAAERAATAAAAALDEAAGAVDRLAARRAEIAERLAAIAGEVDDLRAEDRRLSRAEHDAGAAREDVERRARAARAAVDRARAERERLG